MAQFNADIILGVQVDKAYAAINQIERRISALSKVSKDIQIAGKVDISQAKRSFNVLSKSVRSLTDVLGFASRNALGLVNSLAAVGAVGLINKISPVKTALGGLAEGLTDATAAAVTFTATNPGLVGGIAATTAALVAFGPQLATASARLLKLGAVAGQLKLPLTELVNTYSKLTGAFDDSFVDPKAQFDVAIVEAYRKALFETSETVTELGRRQQNLQTELNKWNSSSATAEKIANKLVTVNARLNDELREQADLLRRASGVNVTELEASKGRKSIETRQRRDSFLGEQAQEQDRILNDFARGIQELNDLQKRLDADRFSTLNRLNDIALTNQIEAADKAAAATLQAEKEANDKALADFDKRLAEQVKKRIEAEKEVRKAADQLDQSLDDLLRAQKAADKQASDNRLKLENFEFQQKLENIDKAAAEDLRQQKRVNDEALKDFDRRLNRRGELKQRRQRTTENLALGAGFPLLFGGGAGAVGGGVAGALVGPDGFGLQVLLSSLGTLFDQAAESALNFSTSLRQSGNAAGTLERILGRIDPDLKSYISNLQSSGQTAAAAEAAQAELAQTIGTDLANAYKKAGDELERNQIATQRFLTALTALGFQAQRLTETRSITGQDFLDLVPEQFRPQEIQENNISQAAQDRVAALEREVDLQKQKTEVAEVNKKTDIDTYAIQRSLLAVQEAKNENEEIYTSLKRGSITAEEAELKVKLKNLRLSEQLLGIERERVDAKTRLDDKAKRDAEKAARADEKAARLAERALQKELRIRAALISEDLKQTDIADKLNALELGKAAAIDDQLAGLDKRKAQERDQIALSTEDVRLQEAKLLTLELQYDLKRRQLEADKAALEVQRQQQRLSGQQELTGLRTQLEQELGGLQLGTNAFDDLATEQANRYANALREINNQLELQKIALTGAQNDEQRGLIEERIANLNAQRTAYQELLPAIAAAEQQQLLYNEALAQVQGPVNALISGFREVIAGTKSVEQAFADFLTTIADQLAQTATTMIAEYIAIGIARAFGLGQSPAVGTQASNFNLTGFGNLGSGAGSGISGFLTGASGIPGMANGGPVNANQPYIVGERGPELFVPFQQGSITSNEAMQQASMAQLPFTRNAESIAQAQHTAQAMQSAGPINVKYESTMINGVEYVTREQAERIGAQSAERGRALTLQALQNSPRTRSKVGI